ncbi:hypothetical protein F511_02672 [Dorcoceras hygrometricum]|uniref:Uncharacterized protein n=1 Tax=Dorcoceras hygrometricum TaxID=472368 RepID=A0A2Z7DB84_9LAMI|nr:hypothetical protein F511_02672 [Dorcoceras hygrometricum]
MESGIAKHMCEICVARDCFVVIIAQKTLGTDVSLFYSFGLSMGYHGYSAGRGVDPAGGAPGGGLAFVVVSSRRIPILVLLARVVLATVVVPRSSFVANVEEGILQRSVLECKHTAAPPQSQGGSSRGRSFPVQQQRLGEPQFRPFHQPGPSRFGQSSQPQFSGPQFAQMNAMMREQAEGTPGGGVIAGYHGYSTVRGVDPAGGAPGGG